MKLIIIASAMTLSILTTPVAVASGYIRCETPNGSILVIQGTTCPPGTVYDGPA